MGLAKNRPYLRNANAAGDVAPLLAAARLADVAAAPSSSSSSSLLKGCHNCSLRWRSPRLTSLQPLLYISIAQLLGRTPMMTADQHQHGETFYMRVVAGGLEAVWDGGEGGVVVAGGLFPGPEGGGKQGYGQSCAVVVTEKRRRGNKKFKAMFRIFRFKNLAFALRASLRASSIPANMLLTSISSAPAGIGKERASPTAVKSMASLLKTAGRASFAWNFSSPPFS
nr:hypothetical protein Iba_chr12fCG8830 [Ipomoea batatas]